MKKLLKDLQRHYAKEGRHHLPWRKTKDPYKILVSEVMLQQTQVERVLPFYKKFVTEFPNARTLSKAPLTKVLRAWQGLGYNRRAKFLREAAKQISLYGFPKDAASWEDLPGVGRYSARAIMAFAYNKPEVFIETNIRTVFLYHSVILQKTKISDLQLLPLVEQALRESHMQPREFYAALMDYGAHLKKSGVKLNSKSAHYGAQKTFKGSARELRGAILRELLRHQASATTLMHKIPRSKEDIARELARLTAEGLVALKGRYFTISK